MSQERSVQQTANGKNIAQAWGDGASASVTVYEFATPAPVDAATLLAARTRLAQLPVDTIPDMANLPEGSRMPFGRNPHFVGREADLKALAKALKTGETASIGRVVASTGLGGIGKTQLAVEFAHRYGQYFAGGVFWHNFIDPSAISVEIAQCGGAGGLNLRPDYEQLDLPTRVQLVLSAWQSPLPRLLIFDGCEEESLLQQWRPPTGGCHVLIPSRRGQWSDSMNVTVMPLSVLSRAESLGLLLKHRPDLASPLSKEKEPGIKTIDAIAAELGDLPLALHLAGSFLETFKDDPYLSDPTIFLSELQTSDLLQHPALQGEDVTLSPTNHLLHVGRTFALSYERLDPHNLTDAMAQQLLARAAHFASGQPIPRKLLLITLQLPEGDAQSGRQAARALNRLVDLGLFEKSVDGGLVLHQLLAKFIRREKMKLVEDVQAIVEETLLTEARKLNNIGDFSQLLSWQLHLRNITDRALIRRDKQAADMAINLGYLLNNIADYFEAHRYYEAALAIYSEVLGEKHPDTVQSMNNLGGLFHDIGDYDNARRYYEQALAINEEVLGKQDRAVAYSLNNLGMLLLDIGDYATCLPYLKQALNIRHMTLGDQHPDTATSLNNLGMLMQTLGDYKGARRYYERALAINRKVWGKQHLSVATNLNNLGTLLHIAKDLTRAYPYLKKALAITRTVLGETHPDTAQSLSNLGSLLHDMGNYDEARSCYEQALTINKALWGEQHLAVAYILNNLGMLLLEMGDYATARQYLGQALAIREGVLKWEHPDMATSLNNLSLLYAQEGDFDQAVKLTDKALAIREKVLGPHHRDTQSSRQSLATMEQELYWKDQEITNE
jgi:tetratricopeptide (TPR) repeat protein